jgi:hypothetical protein
MQMMKGQSQSSHQTWQLSINLTSGLFRKDDDINRCLKKKKMGLDGPAEGRERERAWNEIEDEFGDIREWEEPQIVFGLLNSIDMATTNQQSPTDSTWSASDDKPRVVRLNVLGDECSKDQMIVNQKWKSSRRRRQVCRSAKTTI